MGAQHTRCRISHPSLVKRVPRKYLIRANLDIRNGQGFSYGTLEFIVDVHHTCRQIGASEPSPKGNASCANQTLQKPGERRRDEALYRPRIRIFGTRNAER